MRKYDVETLSLAIGLVLIVLLADSIAELAADAIIGFLEFKWRL